MKGGGSLAFVSCMLTIHFPFIFIFFDPTKFSQRKNQSRHLGYIPTSPKFSQRKNQSRHRGYIHQLPRNFHKKKRTKVDTSRIYPLQLLRLVTFGKLFKKLAPWIAPQLVPNLTKEPKSKIKRKKGENFKKKNSKKNLF
jgi:hypothetical protein